MYAKIMMPVDLAHVEKQGKALKTAADLANLYDIQVCYVGVTAAAPSAVARNPDEFAAKLERLATGESTAHGHSATFHPVVTHDPAIDLDGTLIKAIGDVGADLVVMASHIPGVESYLFASNGGYLAQHAKCTVMVVR